MSIEISLIKEIEKIPVLYNYHLPEYNRKEILEEAWQSVADRTNMCSNDAKEKWRNIRSSFLRSLKQTNKSKKPYYLSGFLQFLIPFLKGTLDYSTVAKNNLDCSQIETQHDDLSQIDVSVNNLLINGVDIKQEVIDIEITNQEAESSGSYDNKDFLHTSAEDLLNQEENDTDLVDSNQGTQDIIHTETRPLNVAYRNRRSFRRSKKIPIVSALKHNSDIARAKLKRQKLEKSMVFRNGSVGSMDIEPSDGTKYFLMSLVPELENMNEEQVRMFKIKVMMLINDIKTNFEVLKSSTSNDNPRLQKRLINLLLKKLEKDK